MLLFSINSFNFADVTDDLFNGIKNNNIEKVKNAIENGAILDEVKDGQTPMEIAIQNNNKVIASLLISSGIEINEESLNIAAKYNSVDIAKLLVNLGVYPSSETIYLIVNHNSTDMINLFVNFKLDLKSIVNNYHIHNAIKNDEAKICKVLIENINLDDYEEYLVSYLFIETINLDSLNCFEVLLKYIDENNLSNFNYIIYDRNMRDQINNRATPLILSPNSENNILNYAIFKNSINIVEFLLKNNFKIENETLLNLSYSSEELNSSNNDTIDDGNSKENFVKDFELNRLKILDLLIKNNADLNSSDKSYGETLLMVAVDRDQADVVKTLIKNKVDLNKVNSKSESALTRAVIADNIILAQLLLENGADVNIKNKNGESLVKLASSVEMRKLLMKYFNINNK